MKNGFTLIELLAVLAIMAIAGAASVVLFSSNNDTADLDELKNKYIQIQDAAITYVDLNNAWLESFTSSNGIYVRITELQNANYISKKLTNPLTGKAFPSSYTVYIYKTSEDGSEEKEFVDTCIISNQGNNTDCIANSKGESCECGVNNPCCN